MQSNQQYGKYNSKEIDFVHLDGLPGIESNEYVHIELIDEGSQIRFEGKHSGNVVNLPYCKLNRVEVMTEIEILTKEKDKSVVGRAAAGGLILGPIGAIIGGMSGVGSKKKQKKKTERFLIINYKSSEGSEIRAISFKFEGLLADSFYSALIDRHIKNHKKESFETTL